jgi:hypothetical protein
MRTTACTLVLFLFIPFFASSAAGSDGKELLRQCQDAIHFVETGEMRDQLSIGFCFGVMYGVNTTIRIMNHGMPDYLKACIPQSGISNEQAARLVIDYLVEHPSELHKNGALLAWEALMGTFQCE